MGDAGNAENRLTRRLQMKKILNHREIRVFLKIRLPVNVEKKIQTHTGRNGLCASTKIASVSSGTTEGAGNAESLISGLRMKLKPKTGTGIKRCPLDQALYKFDPSEKNRFEKA